MALPTWWTWVWASSECWWWTGKPGVLQSMGHKESDMTEWLNSKNHTYILSTLNLPPLLTPSTPLGSYRALGLSSLHHTANSHQLSILHMGVHWKDWCWSWNSNTLATWRKELTHLKRPWCWERFRAGGEGDDRGWDSWMASLTQWTWVWVNSRSWWWTESPGVLWFMGSQRVGQNWVTELNWIYMFQCYSLFVPPSPSPTVSTSLFSVCNCTAALQIGSLIPSF